MDILIIGGDSAIGEACARHWRAGGNSVAVTSRREGARERGAIALDLGAPPDQWSPLPPADCVLICAAVTSMAACETDPRGTSRINIDATLELAGRASAMGAFIMYPSTNFVFDGSRPRRRATDPTCPNIEYGRQKAAVERALLTDGPDAAVVRFAKIIPPEWPLAGSWIGALRTGEAIHPFDDMVMAPIAMDRAVETIDRVAQATQGGLFQMSARSDLTYADASRYLARRLNLDETLVQPVSARTAGLTAEMTPPNTTLDCTDAERIFGLAAPGPEEALDRLAWMS